MNKLIFVILSALSIMANAALEYETVVYDQKFNSSSSIVIDKKEIEKSRAKNLTTLLASQANLSIAQSNFQPYSVYLRGGDSSHVLILVDGVPYYDAASIQRTINLNSLDLKSIQRIEVIKGSQSVVFGGQALSGVIKIDTIPAEIKSGGQVMVQGGSYKSYLDSAGGAKAINDNMMVVVRGSRSGKESVSPVEGSKKTYPTQLGTAEASLVYKGETTETIFKAQTAFDETEIPTTAFPSYRSADTDNFFTSTYQMGLTGILKIKKNYFEPTVSVANQRTARMYVQDATSGGGMATKQDYVGDLLTARLDFFAVNESTLKVRLGGSFSSEKLVYEDSDVLKSNEQATFEGAFAKGDMKLNENVRLEVGARTDSKKFTDHVQTYQVGLTLIEDIKLEYSTGIKQPSLFQLYSAYGNSNLEPERSESASISYEHNLTTDIFFSITAFNNEFRNLIVISGSPQRYENVSKSKTIGAEAMIGLRMPLEQVTATLAAGYQEPRDIDKDNWLVRRPLRTASLKVRKEFDQYGFGFEAIHNGDRRDRQGSTTYGTLSSYTYFNATAEYQPQQNLSFFVRGQNLTNQKYESSFGFYDEGISGIAGMEVTF